MSIKKESAVVTVIGNGHTIFTSNYAFYIENGAKVNLGDGISKLIIEGDNQSHHDPGLVYIKRGSTCIMNNNVTLKNHKGDNYLGGGVTVEGGTFVMNGGNIDNCGIGSNCEATDFGGSVAMVGAGNINKLNSRFNLISGTISGNKASGGAGVFASGYHFAKTNPISMNATIDGISVPSSGGTSGGTESIAASNPGLFINGGLITENTATGTYDSAVSLYAKGLGGGILVSYNSNKVFQIYNAKITSNNAEYGAGISSFYFKTNADIDGCEITGNTAAKNGGGVYLTKNDNSSKTTISNTTITGNTSGDRGAGVYYQQ